MTATIAIPVLKATAPVKPCALKLGFAARHNIEPEVEVFDIADVNSAIERLENGSPRYRVVLKN